MAFDRYAQVRNGDGFDLLPFAEIPVKRTDRYEKYIKGVTRLDLVSYKYYGSCDYAWLILQANPQYGSLEFNIPDKAEIRIPFPLDISLDAYRSSIEEHKKLND